MLIAAVLTGAVEGRIAAARSTHHSYAAAHREMKEHGRPLLVLIGADWCPGCQIMKQTMGRDGIRKSLANRVAYAQVNKDEEARIASRILKGDRIPQLVLFRRTRDGWKATRMIGAQSEGAVQSFVESGLKDALPIETSPTTALSTNDANSDSDSTQTKSESPKTEVIPAKAVSE